MICDLYSYRILWLCDIPYSFGMVGQKIFCHSQIKFGAYTPHAKLNQKANEETLPYLQSYCCDDKKNQTAIVFYFLP